MGVLQPASRWERSRSGRLFAFEWSLRGIAAAPTQGATTAFVGGFSCAANALCQSVMGSDHELSEPWVKEW